jgi:hypothetical protein
MKKIKPEDLRRHMLEDTVGLDAALFRAYATLAAKASHADGVYCHRDEFVPDAATDELFRRGFLAYDVEGNVIVPGIRRLIPAVFVV